MFDLTALYAPAQREPISGPVLANASRRLTGLCRIATFTTIGDETAAT
jgi:hypothetical protein